MPLPLPPTPGCPPGDWSFGGETGELGEAASRCSARDPPARAHFSHLRVALAQVAVGLASWCQHFLVSSAFERRGCGPHVWGPGAKAYV